MQIIEEILDNIKNGKIIDFKIEKNALNESERIVEIPWILSKYKGQEKVFDVGTSFFDVDYFKYFAEILNLGVKEFHSIDIIRRNAAKKQIEFETRPIDNSSGVEVVLIKRGDYSQTQIVYQCI